MVAPETNARDLRTAARKHKIDLRALAVDVVGCKTMIEMVKVVVFGRPR